jgi:hypothetical protein
MLCLALIASGCGGGNGGTASNPPPDPATIASVTVAPQAVTLRRGETLQLNATVRNASGQILEGRSVQWQSEDGNTVTVSATGLVQGLRAGRAAIHASAQGKSASAQIVVNEPPAVVSRVELDSTSVLIEEGERRQMRVTAFDADNNIVLGHGERWSGAGDILQVGPEGLVTALRPGVGSVTVIIDGQLATAAVRVFAEHDHDLIYGRADVGSPEELFALDLRDPAGVSIAVFAPGRHASHGSPSPQGDRIAFVIHGTWDATHWQSMIFVANRDGSGATRLTYLPARNDEPVWSPDGSKIAFSSQPLGSGSDIWVVDVDGTNLVNLTADQPGASHSSPAWSPAMPGIGYRIAYAVKQQGSSNLWTMNADGTGKRAVTNNAEVFDDEPSWSPDGNTIVFTRTASGIFADLFLVPSTGGAGNPLMPAYALPFTQSSPAWSPNGNLIAFISRHGDGATDQVWTIWADGTRLAQRTVELLAHSSPAWIRRP